MLLDHTVETKAIRIRQKPLPGERLAREIAALAGPNAQILAAREVPWASITFAGARHTLLLRFDGWEACDDGDHFANELPEHAFALPGMLVADACLTKVEQVLLPTPRMDVEIEVLLLEDK
jgi:hypothetical protein